MRGVLQFDMTSYKSSADHQDLYFITDNTSAPLFQWVGTGALLTSLSHSPSDASSNGVLTITATLDADKWALCGPGSSDPLV